MPEPSHRSQPPPRMRWAPRVIAVLLALLGQALAAIAMRAVISSMPMSSALVLVSSLIAVAAYQASDAYLVWLVWRRPFAAGSLVRFLAYTPAVFAGKIAAVISGWAPYMQAAGEQWIRLAIYVVVPQVLSSISFVLLLFILSRWFARKLNHGERFVAADGQQFSIAAMAGAVSAFAVLFGTIRWLSRYWDMLLGDVPGGNAFTFAGPYWWIVCGSAFLSLVGAVSWALLMFPRGPWRWPGLGMAVACTVSGIMLYDFAHNQIIASTLPAGVSMFSVYNSITRAAGILLGVGLAIGLFHWAGLRCVRGEPFVQEEADAVATASGP